jgi:hypothetical protein
VPTSFGFAPYFFSLRLLHIEMCRLDFGLRLTFFSPNLIHHEHSTLIIEKENGYYIDEEY